jgi:hypothetical protein
MTLHSRRPALCCAGDWPRRAVGFPGVRVHLSRVRATKASSARTSNLTRWASPVPVHHRATSIAAVTMEPMLSTFSFRAGAEAVPLPTRRTGGTGIAGAARVAELRLAPAAKSTQERDMSYSRPPNVVRVPPRGQGTVHNPNSRIDAAICSICSGAMDCRGVCEGWGAI